MIIEIPKNTSEKKIKTILRGTSGKKAKQKALDLFFGKLPKIEDGLAYQKRIRNEWK